MIAKVVQTDQLPPPLEVPGTDKLCVYGTLKRDYSAHRLLGASVFEGTTFILGYEMISLGGFPGAFKSSDLQQAVYVEVYNVDKTAFLTLDRYEGHPTFFKRELVKTVYGDAWMYILPAEEKYTSIPRIKSGKWGDK